MRKERGQAMVLVVFAIVGMLVMAGLAIDGGRLHSRRRQAQNAADAASLAGARELLQRRISMCEGQSVSLNDLDDAVGLAVLTYAQSNGVQSGPGGEIKAWYVDADENVVEQAGVRQLDAAELNRTTGVRVGLVVTETTTFMKITGRNEMQTGGEATAMFGPVTQVGGGVLPIGVPLDVVEALDPGEQFHILETNSHEGGSFCTDPDDPDTCVGDPAAHNAHRGWLNLNFIYNMEYTAQSSPHYRTFENNVPNRGCGADPNASTDDGLQGWAGEDKDNDGVADCPYPHPIFAGRPPDPDGTRYVNGDFIHGDPGARDVSAQNIEDTYQGEIAYALIFDHIYMSDYMDENFPPPEGIGWPRAGGGGHAFLYHIVGFVGMEIVDYQKGGPNKALVGSFKSAIIGEGSFTPGFGPAFGSGDPCAATLYSLALWK
ncbi:MAG: Tad domain-containing protein [Anaerolineae bacterium]